VGQHLDKLDFCFAVGALGYPHDAGEVFDILDWEIDGQDGITHKELRCLEAWTPVEWLSAAPNPAEAEAFKTMLSNKFRHPLKAWQALDEDRAGKVSYKEFSICAARIGFRADTGHDVPGAWMALDGDASGYIALTEINPHCASALSEFRRWANLFFGSVMSAFMALDVDGGGSLSRNEFKKSVTKFNFRGDREELFSMLDIGGDGDINVEEMSFLDEWEYTEVCDDPVPTFLQVEEMLRANKDHESESEDDDDGEEEDVVLDPQVLMRKRDGQYLKEHHLPLDVHKPMPGLALVELLGGLDAKGRVTPPLTHQAHSRNEASCFSTSCVLPFMPPSMTSPRLGSPLRRASTQSPRKNRSLRRVPYIGGAPLMKRPAREYRCAPSPFLLPLFH